MLNTQTATTPKWMLWTGWIVSALPVLMLLMSGAMKLAKPAFMLEQLEHLQWPESLLLGIWITEMACAIIYAIPQTAVLGAILVTGYLGGAIATHLRIGDPFFGPIVPAVLAWIGIFLREPRLRAVLPWRR